MFRILLIIGLLIAGTQQGFARGAADVSAEVVSGAVSMDAAGARLEEAGLDGEQAAESKPSSCKNSECKAVMAGISVVSRDDQDHPDGAPVRRQMSVPERLEPKPPNS